MSRSPSTTQDVTRSLTPRARWLAVVIFATAMAWFEAACVYYLRLLVDRVVPYQENPLPIRGELGEVEILREAATLVMLFALGLLAGTTWRARLGYTAIAFGVWDIFYYVFLHAICGWPVSLLDWDILFLLPLPWWGPVIAPVTIALLMVAGGTLATQSSEATGTTALTRTAWRMSWLGIALALYVFMADALRAVQQGVDVMNMPLPTTFNWPLFALAVALMAAPVARLAWRPRQPAPVRATS